MRQFSVKTQARSQMIDITAQVRSILRESRVENGVCFVFVPHTTAAVTINENADPDVPRDILAQLDKTIPLRGDYLHSEGNSAAHIKASLFGHRRRSSWRRAASSSGHGSRSSSVSSTVPGPGRFTSGLFLENEEQGTGNGKAGLLSLAGFFITSSRS